MHGNHELIEAAAALVLWIGGGLILASMAVTRRRIRPITASVPIARGTAGRTDVSTALPAITAVRRAETLVLAGLSAGAAVIHLAAAPGHVAELGDLGLGFYWAVLFQAGWAAAIAARPSSSAVAWLGVAGNGVILAAWAWSRLVGLPGVPGGPEAVGVADGTAVAFQLGILLLIAAARTGFDVARMRRWSPDQVRSLATGLPVAVLGLVAIAVVIAIVDPASAHSHLLATT
jgi:hypothetical protein